MNRVIQRWNALSLPEASLPAALLLTGLAAYGLLIPYLGFYWDDFPIAWIAEKLGRDGLARYFSTNRPFWGLLYQATTPIFGSEPALWQIFALFWRWAGALAFWALLRQVWPALPRLAAWASLLFMVYPGFGQQFIGLVYSHFFIVLTAFILSLYLHILALKKPGAFWPLSGLALLLSAANLIAMEYFFLLELLRPLLVWWALAGLQPNWAVRLKKTALNWLPYLAVFLGAGIWRAFFFQFQTQNYQPLLLEGLRSEPAAALLRLLGHIFLSLWQVLAAAWLRIFALPNPAELGGRTTLLYGLLVGLTLLLAAAYLSRYPADRSSQPRLAWQAVLTGAAACFAAGWPFWLLDLIPSLTFPLDRFTLPFMLGACLLAAGLLAALPLRQWMRLAVFVLLLSFSVGYQFQLGSQYRRDWETQRRFFWQMSWRIPALQENTLLLVNDLPLTYYSDNSLTAPLNWIYAPQNHSDRMSYLLYYPSVRLQGNLAHLPAGAPVELDYLAANFSGSTAQVVAVVYEPPGCVRVLDAGVDPYNRMLPAAMRTAAALSDPAAILPAASGAQPPAHLYGVEPRHAWCYYFARADLARQQGEWDQVTALGDQAFSLGDYPNDPSERLTFIEGYAHTGNWARALQLTEEAADITPVMHIPLCRLWKRIEHEAPPSPEKEAALDSLREVISCSS